MTSFSRPKEKLNLEFTTQPLIAAQNRALKSLVHSLETVINAQEEKEFFEGSAEAVKFLAFLITQSNFGKENQLSHQALEYGLDKLGEILETSIVLHVDN